MTFTIIFLVLIFIGMVFRILGSWGFSRLIMLDVFHRNACWEDDSVDSLTSNLWRGGLILFEVASAAFVLHLRYSDFLLLETIFVVILYHIAWSKIYLVSRYCYLCLFPPSCLQAWILAGLITGGS